MITSLYDLDKGCWNCTTKERIHSLATDAMKELEISLGEVLQAKDPLGRIPIYYAIKCGGTKEVVQYMKDLMIENGGNKKFLSNIVDHNMITSLYECDIDSESWKRTTADHIALLVESTGVGLSKNAGRWDKIPIFYAVTYSARLPVLAYMFSNNKEDTLAWRSENGSTLLHYAATWGTKTEYMLPYLLFMYGLRERYRQNEEGESAMDIAHKFNRTESTCVLSKPFKPMKERFQTLIRENEHNTAVLKRFNSALEEFTELLKQYDMWQEAGITKYYRFDNAGDYYLLEFRSNMNESLWAHVQAQNSIDAFAENGPVILKNVNFHRLWFGNEMVKEDEQMLIWTFLKNMYACAHEYIDIKESDLDGLYDDYSILHFAIGLCADLYDVQEILSEEPRLTSSIDREGRYALHIAAVAIEVNKPGTFELSLQYIRAILQVDVDAAIQMDRCGNTLLHLICALPFDLTGAPNDRAQDLHLRVVQALYYAMPATFRDKEGCSRDDLLRYHCHWPKSTLWSNLLSSTYGRYKISNTHSPIHTSLNSTIHYAVDLVADPNEHVVLKVLHDRSVFQREIYARFVKCRTGSEEHLDQSVLNIFGWHVPNDDETMLHWRPAKEESQCIVTSLHQFERPERTHVSNEFVLVLEPGVTSLRRNMHCHFFAGHNLPTVQDVFRQLVTKTQHLHACGIAHCNISPSHIVHTSEKTDSAQPSLKFCDVQGALNFDTRRTKDDSCNFAYASPEYAKYVLAHVNDTKGVLVKPSMDIWSLGAILYELCAGHALFPQRAMGKKVVVSDIDLTRLCVWHTISNKDLDIHIFPGVIEDPWTVARIQDAKDLIRWCLKGDEDERPSLCDILNHRFLINAKNGLPLPEEESMNADEAPDKNLENQLEHDDVLALQERQSKELYILGKQLDAAQHRHRDKIKLLSQKHSVALYFLKLHLLPVHPHVLKLKEKHAREMNEVEHKVPLDDHLKAKHSMIADRHALEIRAKQATLLPQDPRLQALREKHAEDIHLLRKTMLPDDDYATKIEALQAKHSSELWKHKGSLLPEHPHVLRLSQTHVREIQCLKEKLLPVHIHDEAMSTLQEKHFNDMYALKSYLHEKDTREMGNPSEALKRQQESNIRTLKDHLLPEHPRLSKLKEAHEHEILEFYGKEAFLQNAGEEQTRELRDKHAREIEKLKEELLPEDPRVALLRKQQFEEMLKLKEKMIPIDVRNQHSEDQLFFPEAFSQMKQVHAEQIQALKAKLVPEHPEVLSLCKTHLEEMDKLGKKMPPLAMHTKEYEDLKQKHANDICVLKDKLEKEVQDWKELLLTFSAVYDGNGVVPPLMHPDSLVLQDKHMHEIQQLKNKLLPVDTQQKKHDEMKFRHAIEIQDLRIKVGTERCLLDPLQQHCLETPRSNPPLTPMLIGEPREPAADQGVRTQEELLASKTVAPRLPMKYHAFLCHVPGDASGPATTVSSCLEGMGINVWYEMPVVPLDLDAVKQAVLDSDVFLLILTDQVIKSKICMHAFATAIEHQKTVQLIIENESCFNPFDESKDWWNGLVAEGAEQANEEARLKAFDNLEKSIARLHEATADPSGMHDLASLEKDADEKENILGRVMERISAQENKKKIVEMVKELLPNGVPYRRRSYEQAAMVREICKRCKWTLPTLPQNENEVYLTNLSEKCVVYVLYNSFNTEEYYDNLKREIPFVKFTEDFNDLNRATSVIVILSKGFRIRKRDGFFRNVIEADRRYGNRVDRLILCKKLHSLESTSSMSKDDGWMIGDDTLNKDPGDVKDAIENHIPITFRPKYVKVTKTVGIGKEIEEYVLIGGQSRHEFDAMKYELIRQIRQMHEAYYSHVREGMYRDEMIKTLVELGFSKTAIDALGGDSQRLKAAIIEARKKQ